MKRYGILATLAFAALAAAAVWYGGLNQDEGWYLYAARLVEEGKVPYRDFAYTQGPLLPIVYSVFCGAWERFGLIGGRVVTLLTGLMGLLFATALSRLLASDGRKGAAGVIAFMLLGCNLYHIYYLTIPKTYALAGLFLLAGFYLLAFALSRCRARFLRGMVLFGSGLCLALSAGARISMGACLGATGLALLAMKRRYGWAFASLGLGGAVGLALIYGPFVALAGFREAVAYHMARGGFSPEVAIGSLSRLVRWYLPVFVLGGMALFRLSGKGGAFETKPDARSPKPIFAILLLSFVAAFAVHMAAPFPYEDYQVPIMALLAVVIAAKISSVATVSVGRVALLTLGMTWACSFGSPLLEKWAADQQDRLWPQIKPRTELQELQRMAQVIEYLDPGGKELLTQDLYLAIETNRKVPQGLEMGPFAILSDEEWVRLLESAPCRIAACSGYTFAVNPPVCDERPLKQQIKYWNILSSRYYRVFKNNSFGQSSTPLEILIRKTDLPAPQDGVAESQQGGQT